jgi:hypothetical protein
MEQTLFDLQPYTKKNKRNDQPENNKTAECERAVRLIAWLGCNSKFVFTSYKKIIPHLQNGAYIIDHYNCGIQDGPMICINEGDYFGVSKKVLGILIKRNIVRCTFEYSTEQPFTDTYEYKLIAA